jgi:hypothetical protein
MELMSNFSRKLSSLARFLALDDGGTVTLLIRESRLYLLRRFCKLVCVVLLLAAHTGDCVRACLAHHRQI